MRRIICLLMLVLAVPGLVSAVDWRAKKFDFAVSAGFIPNPKIEASFEKDFPADESFDFKADPVPLIRLIADYHVVPNVSMAFNINYAAIRLEEELDLGTWDGVTHRVPREIGMLEFNGGIKGRFFINPQVIIKPGIYLGFRTTFADSADGCEKGVALNGSVEVQYLLEQTYIFTDIGFLSQPYGGVEDVGYVRAGPTLYLCAGIGI